MEEKSLLNQQQNDFKVKKNQFSGVCQDYRIWPLREKGEATRCLGALSTVPKCRLLAINLAFR